MRRIVLQCDGYGLQKSLGEKTGHWDTNEGKNVKQVKK
jgi:hypothetical protein